MPVEIRINGEDAGQAMREISGLFDAFSAVAAKVDEVRTAETATDKPAPAVAKPAAKRSRKKAEPKAEEPTGPTLENAQDKLKELGAAADFDTAKALLVKFGVGKVQDLPADKFQDWIDGCDAEIEAAKAKELE